MLATEARESSAEGLLERDAELSELDRALEAAAGGQGQLLVVDGPAGIGKTSLLAALRERAHARGFAASFARGSELEREFSFGVARQLFEGPVRELDEATLL